MATPKHVHQTGAAKAGRGQGTCGGHMADDQVASLARGDEGEPSRPLTPQARRALAEAEARRAAQVAGNAAPREIGGQHGPDPTRYGDWEKGGLTSDF